MAFPRVDQVFERHGKHSDRVRWRRKEGHVAGRACERENMFEFESVRMHEVR